MASELFKGRFNQELFSEYGRWLPYIRDFFLPIVDSELGDLRSLPFEGPIADQPYMTMQIIYIIQAVFRKTISDKQKANMQKARSSHR